jgi:CubicO group peptidase (beta-lactamase class C family)
LAQYLPGLPQAWQELTVHHLLSHQSGLPDLINRWPRQRLDGFAFQDLMVYFSTHAELEFKPGSKGQYSNTNYVLLAELVSQVSGKDFGEYLRCHVFEPAGMVSSSVSVRSSQALSQALPYGNEVKPNDIDYVLLGAINQKSSVLDLEHFMDALLQNKLLQQATLDRMMKPHVQFDDGKRYGYGWYIGRLGGWAALSTELPAAGVGHSGRLGAYRSALYFNRERDFQLIMLSNGGIRTEKLLVDFLQKTREFLE